MKGKIRIIKNANVVLENGIIWDGGIVIEDNKIVKPDRLSNIEIPDGAEIVDANGAYVGPGFVDIHVHGGVGQRLFDEPEIVAAHFLKHGETSILASWSGAYTYKVIGMDDEIGSIEPGKIADLVFVDDKFNVQQVMVGGEICKF